MSAEKYTLPSFLRGRFLENSYKQWLYKKARACYNRDEQLGKCLGTREKYRKMIHKAVVNSKGRDAYTGENLEWELIGEYNNNDSKKQGKRYKKKFDFLPTVDYLGEYDNDFVICGWRTNDCKGDLTQEELKEFCERVQKHLKKKSIFKWR